MLSIKEDNAFKVYKCNGRPVLVLRISMPQIDLQSESCMRFNSFYYRVESECIDGAEKLAEQISNLEEKESVYISFSVSFAADYVGEMLKITRIYELKRGTRCISSKSVTDIFTKDLFFAKTFKNVIKQRIVPSRKGKNITKDKAKNEVEAKKP